MAENQDSNKKAQDTKKSLKEIADVTKAIEEGFIDWRHINNSSGQKFKNKSQFDSWANTPAGKKELFERNYTEEIINEWIEYI